MSKEYFEQKKKLITTKKIKITSITDHNKNNTDNYHSLLDLVHSFHKLVK